MYLLNECGSNSLELHREIALYLGMNKYHLERVHETVDGNFVRSKSEVIVCNLLHEAGIKYEYEKPLYYEDGKYMIPDFTLTLSDGRILYWEHVGLLGRDSYDANWNYKLDIYEKYYPGQMIRSYESGTLSKSVKKIIQNLLGQ